MATPNRGKAWGVSPRMSLELEPFRQFAVVYNFDLATSATALVPNCNGPAVPLDLSATRRGRHVTQEITACPLYVFAQAYPCTPIGCAIHISHS